MNSCALCFSADLCGSRIIRSGRFRLGGPGTGFVFGRFGSAVPYMIIVTGGFFVVLMSLLWDF